MKLSPKTAMAFLLAAHIWAAPHSLYAQENSDTDIAKQEETVKDAQTVKEALSNSRISSDQTVNIDTLNVETLTIESTAQTSPNITFHSNEALKKSGTPFSSAVEVDGWIFLAGMLGTKPGVGVVPGGIVPETRQAMERIKAELAKRGVGMNRIVRCLVILADFNDFAAFNGAYKEYFDGNYPARSTFAAKTLAANARVEIECTARR